MSYKVIKGKGIQYVSLYPYKNNRKPKQEESYDNIFCFDIETTTAYNIDGERKPYDYNIPSESYKEIPQYTFCYVWQFGIEENVVYGRNIQDFRFFLNMLVNKYKANLVIYVHNLSFEWQFLYQFVHVNKVFATDTHKVLKAAFDDFFEMRCSYYLSNMSLAKFVENITFSH